MVETLEEALALLAPNDMPVATEELVTSVGVGSIIEGGICVVSIIGTVVYVDSSANVGQRGSSKISLQAMCAA